jgi:hypothetical protein
MTIQVVGRCTIILPAAGENPIFFAASCRDPVLQTASRGFLVAEAQIKVIEKLGRFQAEVVEVPRAIDWRDVY